MLPKLLLTFGVGASVVLLMGSGAPQSAPPLSSSPIQVNVVLVQLNIAVTDRKGHYVSGLHPQDFAVYEDKIPENIAWFEEGDQSGRRMIKVGPSGAPVGSAAAQAAVAQHAQSGPSGPQSGMSLTSQEGARQALEEMPGANVFVLFDTSNYMYRNFVFAQDAITGFVRSMTGPDRIAFYSYSRDLSKGSTLTNDRPRILNAVRNSVAGDDAALYNSLLMTVQDAAPLRGRKAIVVFSNGPDNASSVPPEDVEELAQSTGTIIYIISTRQAESEPVSSAVFERMSRATGGKAYFAKNWEEEGKAFASIRDDLSHLYTLSYYPKPNQNRGWRKITVKLVGSGTQSYRVRTRDGYRLLEQPPAATLRVAEHGSAASDPVEQH
ncbi:MAG TPA: VWA domain-containing protein [Acidobacteriaceae bacterium]|nr:VWA domain-containing protein [Acidobacteriaceae bacterium]